VTEVLPPQADGAPVLLFVKTPLHPPDADAVPSHVVKAASMAVWDWQDATVVLVGQVRETPCDWIVKLKLSMAI